MGNSMGTTRKAVKRAVGRPTAFQASYADQAYKLALLGQTDVEMAAFFGVAESTLHLWKKRHPEFSESIKRGKHLADAAVAETLYRTALGGVEVTDTREQTDGDGNLVSVTRETRQIPPSTTAMIFWLKNRNPALWRDRVEADVKVSAVDKTYLQNLYVERMRQARERQHAILLERGVPIDPSSLLPTSHKQGSGRSCLDWRYQG